MKKQTASLVILVLFLTTLFVFSQTSSQFPELDKNGKPVFPRPMPHIVYSPVDLAHSAVVLPASIGGATPNTAIIRLGDATKMTFFASTGVVRTNPGSGSPENIAWDAPIVISSARAS